MEFAQKLLIVLKNGHAQEIILEDLETQSNIHGDLIHVKWNGIEGKPRPHYIRLEDISAIYYLGEVTV